jgi:hypothetical protein
LNYKEIRRIQMEEGGEKLGRLQVVGFDDGLGEF